MPTWFFLQFQEWILSKNLVLLFLDLYDGDPKSMRFIRNCWIILKSLIFYLGTKEWNLRDKIISSSLLAIPIIAIFPLNPKSSIFFSAADNCPFPHQW
jgi:hypothetical protein